MCTIIPPKEMWVIKAVLDNGSQIYAITQTIATTWHLRLLEIGTTGGQTTNYDHMVVHFQLTRDFQMETII